jgi:hypothetical protein
LRSADLLTGMTFILSDKVRHAQNLNCLCPLYDTSAFKKSLNSELTVIYIVTKHTLPVHLPIVATAQL